MGKQDLFEVGDEVKCIDDKASFYHTQLVKGRRYIVAAVYVDNMIELKEYPKLIYNSCRFKLTGVAKKKNASISEREHAAQAVMDLYYALKAIGGTPTLKDLVKLAKRIKKG